MLEINISNLRSNFFSTLEVFLATFIRWSPCIKQSLSHSSRVTWTVLITIIIFLSSFHPSCLQAKGLFLEGPERFLHQESGGKISNLIILKSCFIHILISTEVPFIPSFCTPVKFPRLSRNSPVSSSNFLLIMYLRLELFSLGFQFVYTFQY